MLVEFFLFMFQCFLMTLRRMRINTLSMESLVYGRYLMMMMTLWQTSHALWKLLIVHCHVWHDCYCCSTFSPASSLRSSSSSSSSSSYSTFINSYGSATLVSHCSLFTTLQWLITGPKKKETKCFNVIPCCPFSSIVNPFQLDWDLCPLYPKWVRLPRFNYVQVIDSL